jgi:hypothetical protein
MVLYFGAAVLVSMLFWIGTWLRWPYAIIDDEKIRDAFIQFSFGFSIYWGIVYSLILFLVYAPSAFVLDQRARSLAKEVGAKTHGDELEWRRTHSLVSGKNLQIADAIAIAGPVVSVLFGTFVDKVFDL